MNNYDDKHAEFFRKLMYLNNEGFIKILNNIPHIEEIEEAICNSTKQKVDLIKAAYYKGKPPPKNDKEENKEE